MRRLLVIVCCGMIGCGSDALPGRPDPKGKFESPDKVVKFETLFAKNCAGCHGENGTFGPAPPLNDPIFLAITSDDDLTMIVSNGRHGTEMPAFAKNKGGTLTSEQIQALVAGLRKWAGTPPKHDWAAYTTQGKGDKDKGLAFFSRVCAECHGPDGKKDGMAINDKAFLDLASESLLRRIVITGRPDLKMPDCTKTKCGPADVDDVVALLMYWKRSP